MTRRTGMLCATALFLAMTGTSFATEQGGRPEGGPHRGLPPEAFTACASLSEGASCTANTPHGTQQGTCHQAESKGLACLLKNPPPGEGQGGHGDHGGMAPPDDGGTNITR